jgi:hypothetical protein
MLEKIDSGKRKLSLKCDQFGIMARGPHTKTFNPPNAYDDAMAFAKANGFQDKAVIEKIMEMPYVPPVMGSGPIPVLPDRPLTDEERAIEIAAEMYELGDELIEILAKLRGQSTRPLRSSLTKLGRTLKELTAAMRAAI